MSYLQSFYITKIKIIFIEVPVPRQESDRSCICILWLHVSDFAIGFYNCSDSVVFSCLSCYYKPKVEYQLVKVWFMVFSATFTNILAISWRSVLFVEETGVSG